MPNAVVLSILLPAYNYPEGIARTLTTLSTLRDRKDVEVLIYDDSSNTQAAEAIRVHAARAFPRASYRRNTPPLGAPGNWNRLLADARGRHLWLIHHDEWPGDRHLAEDLVRTLEGEAPPDVIVLGCRATRDVHKAFKLHFPMSWVGRVVKDYPHYLLRRNVIGAPSMVVANRSLYGSFDARLRWYVDVELYYRMFRQQPKLVVLHDRFVLSLIRQDSITAEVRPEIAALRSAEKDYLRNKLGPTDRSDWITRPDWTGRLARAAEQGVWMVARGVASLLGSFGSKKIGAVPFGDDASLTKR
ncbi:glycosyltransferase [Piscinibacter sp. HJYY11]|uniref:glycosyltransferase family 2 protein n=1 Tax=Piscinibacter sp. HJYY11 TaxID=2801333 RepID=UPI00191FEFF8|nr:glycosyltransferase [Piscinibacter sp. HJYY11]MBL0727920.1 glycosyltransferase family 2 protein [Piscinibacter sp. HJYY11]